MSDDDLELERLLDAPRHRVWQAWTDAEQFRQWWAPHPYRIEECEMDLRPGGIFRTRMTGPGGFDSSGTGCFLEVEQERRISWTTALGPGYRPVDPTDCGGFPMTAIVTFEDAGDGRTRYRARALHRNMADRDAHKAMGFHEGWNIVADQLEQAARRLEETA